MNLLPHLFGSFTLVFLLIFFSSFQEEEDFIQWSLNSPSLDENGNITVKVGDLVPIDVGFETTDANFGIGGSRLNVEITDINFPENVKEFDP
ncbi:hypothetical protein [Xanthovirga aplysinae]|uniref:hypothetical protein n=1 Tax=Xanthovirga aplysinae TaxID=2529853 RepID=UPI0012BD4F74|nr:hypothetical protein [Xanthovirga aplysinae]MTI31900.1 hypothetical protein [Xanthovirga aplysinae]